MSFHIAIRAFEFAKSHQVMDFPQNVREGLAVEQSKIISLPFFVFSRRTLAGR